MNRPQTFADRYAFTVPTIVGQVSISMTSATLDPYLYLMVGDVVGIENDDSNGTRNARIPINNGVLALMPGTYVIEATSFFPNATGAYTLTVASPPANAFVASGRVTVGGLPQQGVTISFARVSGSQPVPPPVLTDAAGIWSQTFTSGSGYVATATRANFDYAPSASVTFTTGRSDLNFVGTPSSTNCVATPIVFGQTRTGMLTADDCLATDRPQSFNDRYTFTLTAPSQVVITMSSATFDTYVYLRDVDGDFTRGRERRLRHRPRTPGWCTRTCRPATTRSRRRRSPTPPSAPTR